MPAECQLSLAAIQLPDSLNYEHLPVGCMQVGKIMTNPNISSILGPGLGAGKLHLRRGI